MKNSSPVSPRTSSPHLIGVGVGPGDPELITVRAVRILEMADVILVPAADTSDADIGRAEAVVLAACPSVVDRVRRIPFSMAARHGVDRRRRDAWQMSADEAVRAFSSGAGSVVFATVGDPSIYSTFSYLADTVRSLVDGCQVSVVPGITAMQALAASSVTPLVEGQEMLALIPVTSGLDAFARALDGADTVVVYKIGGHLAEVAKLLRERNCDAEAILGVDVGLPTESIKRLAETDSNATSYFSTLIVPPTRTRTGERL